MCDYVFFLWVHCCNFGCEHMVVAAGVVSGYDSAYEHMVVVLDVYMWL